MDFQAAAQILRDMPHTWDTRSLAIRYGGRRTVIGDGHECDGIAAMPLLP